MKVVDLTPGDVIAEAGLSGIFIARMKHPKYWDLQLVIWFLPNQGVFSFDALSPLQEVGELETLNDQDRLRNLERALTPQL